MKPRITLLTLGVDDIERALVFYRDGLGFPTKGIIGKEFEHGAVAFFDLQPGLKLALWNRDNLAWDTGIPKTAISPTEFSIPPGNSATLGGGFPCLGASETALVMMPPRRSRSMTPSSSRP